MQRYQVQYYRRLIHSERQMRAVEQIFRAFEENGIDYMPVKGCNMKKLYPQPEMRVMGDADILIRPEQHEKIKPIMERLGFIFRIENEHVFEWHSDSLHVELHKSLVPPNDEDYYAYYDTGWSLAAKTEGHRYDLSQEDTFIFLFTHFARHYRFSGIGCRHVMDLYVYRQAHPELKETYVERELEKLRLLEFYRNTLRLLDAWFHGGEMNEITELMTSYIFSGGSWGSAEAMLFSQQIKQARKQGKIKHSGAQSVLRILFPSLSTMRYRYKILGKAPYLLPVVWVVRWIDILFFRPQKIKSKLRILRTIDDESVLTRQNALQAVGLDFHFTEDFKS